MAVVVSLSIMRAIDVIFLAGDRLPYIAARNGQLPQVNIKILKSIFFSIKCLFGMLLLPVFADEVRCQKTCILLAVFRRSL